jgi:hypothetical protein
MIKRLWFDLLAVLGLAEHAVSCERFRGFGVYPAEACLLVETAGRGRIGSNGASDQPAPPWVTSSHVDGDAGQRWDRPALTYYLRLTHPDRDGDGGDGLTLLELLRTSRNAAWFTIDVEDGETASYATRASREVDDSPRGATGLPARVQTELLGPDPGQQDATMNTGSHAAADPDPEQTQRLSVGDPALGKTRLLVRECPTCIFKPGNLMHLTPGRLRQMVTQAHGEAGYVICHSTLPYHHDGAQPAICRGFADRYATWQLQVIERLWGFVEVEPPPAHDATDQSAE